MTFDDLTDDNFLLYAMKFYNNPQCLTEKDFHDDMKIFKYIKRLINRYLLTGDLKHRLILNHIIMLGNIFPIPVATRILFFKLPKNMWVVLKSFLIYLNYMPEIVDKVYGEKIYNYSLEVDIKIVKSLREL